MVFVFFFFKQKTAYEMRISDWSSDVCSSDLLGIALEVHRRDEAAADAGDHDGVERFGLDLARRGRLPGLLFLRNLGVGRRDLGGNRGCQGQQQCGAQQPAPWNRTHLLHGISLPGTSRSEEPTYEITSLMRISYAVLC